MVIKDFYHAPDQGEIITRATTSASSGLSIDEIKLSVDNIVIDSHDFAQEDFLVQERTRGTNAIKEFLNYRNPENVSDMNITFNQVAKHFDDFKKFFMSLSQARRSRAGKTFELILKQVFDYCDIPYSYQPRDVDGRPDFIIPGETGYRQTPQETLVVTAKRTVRERWRQITTEGTRGYRFYLATLDPDISKDTLDEMNRNHVSLIVPKPIIDGNNVYEQSSTIYSYHDLFNRLIPNCLQYWNR